MLFVHFLRLLYTFQTDIRQMLNTCLTDASMQAENEHLAPVWDQNSHLPGEMMRWAAHYDNFIDQPATPLTKEQEPSAVKCGAKTSSVACEKGNFKYGDFIFSSQLRQKNSLGGLRLTVGCTVPHVAKLWSGEKRLEFSSGCSGGQQVLKQQPWLQITHINLSLKQHTALSHNIFFSVRVCWPLNKAINIFNPSF